MHRTHIELATVEDHRVCKSEFMSERSETVSGWNDHSEGHRFDAKNGSNLLIVRETFV